MQARERIGVWRRWAARTRSRWLSGSTSCAATATQQSCNRNRNKILVFRRKFLLSIWKDKVYIIRTFFLFWMTAGLIDRWPEAVWPAWWTKKTRPTWSQCQNEFPRRSTSGGCCLVCIFCHLYGFQWIFSWDCFILASKEGLFLILILLVYSTVRKLIRDVDI